MLETKNPEFPLEVFPKGIQPYLEWMHKYMGISTGFIGTSVLGALATAIGSNTIVEYAQFKEPMNLYTVLVGAASSDTRESWKYAFKPLLEWKKPSSLKYIGLGEKEKQTCIWIFEDECPAKYGDRYWDYLANAFIPGDITASRVNFQGNIQPGYLAGFLKGYFSRFLFAYNSEFNRIDPTEVEFPNSKYFRYNLTIDHIYAYFSVFQHHQTRFLKVSTEAGEMIKDFYNYLYEWGHEGETNIERTHRSILKIPMMQYTLRFAGILQITENVIFDLDPLIEISDTTMNKAIKMAKYFMDCYVQVLSHIPVAAGDADYR